MRLPRRVLALTGREHLTEDRFGHLGLVDPGAAHDGVEHRGAKLMGGRVGESAVEAADSRAASRYDYDIGHEICSSRRNPWHPGRHAPLPLCSMT